MRLITWNVNRRVSVLAGQAAALAGREPDVVALQEVTAGSWPLWRAALETVGLPHAACSLDGGVPGTLMLSDCPRIPATPRESIQWRVCSREASRIASASPGASRSITARVASGVTS